MELILFPQWRESKALLMFFGCHSDTVQCICQYLGERAEGSEREGESAKAVSFINGYALRSPYRTSFILVFQCTTAHTKGVQSTNAACQLGRILLLVSVVRSDVRKVSKVKGRTSEYYTLNWSQWEALRYSENWLNLRDSHWFKLTHNNPKYLGWNLAFRI